jgi:hypothetical protein
MTSIFPERDTGCHLQAVDQSNNDRSICNTPLGYVSGCPPSGLMSLKTFVDERGDELPNAKILVRVKAVGRETSCQSHYFSLTRSQHGRLKLKVLPVTSTQGYPVATIKISIYDESTEATLSIYGPLIRSAREWAQRETTLLITSPGKRPDRKLSINARTLVEIDPDIGESACLRRWIQREDCPINDHFPSDVFNVKSCVHAPLRLQFTLASLDSFIRASPWQVHAGYLSVVLTDLHLLSLWKRGQLFSMECCGTPVYANAISGRCEQCRTCDIRLRINPNLVGEITDETGAISCLSPPDEPDAGRSPKAVGCNKRQHSKILWTDEAWTKLLGRSPEQLAALCDEGAGEKAHHNAELVRYLEQRLLFMRVIFFVGWTGDSHGGRLAVLSVVG